MYMTLSYDLPYVLRSLSYVAAIGDCCRGWLRQTRIPAAEAAFERDTNRCPKRSIQSVACRCGDHKHFPVQSITYWLGGQSFTGTLPNAKS